MTALALSQDRQRTIAPPIEAVAAAVLAALAYITLQGELPYHDAVRFTNQLKAGSFVWDIGHILLQPMALLLQRLSGADPIVVLKMLSSLSTAAAVGLFHLLLRRLEMPGWQAVLGTLLLAGSCSVLMLAPSAHPKLVALPFLTGAFLCLCMAERRRQDPALLLLAGGTLLALGAAFFAGVLSTAPFAAIAVLLSGLLAGAGWGRSLWRAILMTTACGLTFLLIACAGYMVLTGDPLSVAGLTGSVTGKAELRPPPLSLAVQLARVVFGTVNNLIAAPGLGATVQAFMRGQIPSLRPYAGLLPELALFLAVGLLILVIYLRTGVALLRGQTLLMPVAFLSGAQAWTIWYGLNDPEHWVALTAPTIVLFLTLMPQNVLRIGLPAWALVATVANMALLALPVSRYRLATNEVELARIVGPNGLLVSFASYPGRAYVGFFTMPGLARQRIDLQLLEPGARTPEVLRGLAADIDRTLHDGGRVIIADILSPLDWEAPWMSLLGRNVTKAQLTELLMQGHHAVRVAGVDDIELWELLTAPVR